MDCAEARRAMLEADPAVLMAPGDSDLGRHLVTCERCRAAARAILEAEARLGAWLGGLTPGTEVGAALERAASLARRRTLVRRLGGPAALAAAAVLAGIMLVPRQAQLPGPPPAREPEGPTGFSVTAPPGRDVVVLHTANPKIVVVWYLPTRRT